MSLQRKIPWLTRHCLAQAAASTSWTVQRSSGPRQPDPNRPPTQVDAIVEVSGPQGVVTIIVEAKRTFMPKDAEQLFLV